MMDLSSLIQSERITPIFLEKQAESTGNSVKRLSLMGPLHLFGQTLILKKLAYQENSPERYRFGFGLIRYNKTKPGLYGYGDRSNYDDLDKFWGNKQYIRQRIFVLNQ